jgi:hypothetical protein
MKLPKIKYTEVTKKSYESDTSSIEFTLEINGKFARGFWRPTNQFIINGVDINELRVNFKQVGFVHTTFDIIDIYSNGGYNKCYEIYSKPEIAEKQPKDLRFTGRTLTIKNFKKDFIDKIKATLNGTGREGVTLSKEFLDYFQLNLES